MRVTAQILFIALITVGSLSAGLAQPAAQTVQPLVHGRAVLDRDFPDPTVIRVPGGKYYAYATQGDFNGRFLNIQVAESSDLLHWQTLGDALPVKPTWADRTHDFWAPHVLYDPRTRKYVMFFSSSSNDTSQGKCIGVALADHPRGPFFDKGSPLVCGAGFVNIDPMAFVDPATGKKLLYWGSGFAPLRVQEMSDDWTNFKPGSVLKELVRPGLESAYTKLLEGPWLDYDQGRYYLYYSGDNCCGEQANYAVMVARSNNAFGPFTRVGEARATNNSVILEQDSTWMAPGHNSVVIDAKGRKWIAYHAIHRDRSPAKTGRTTRVMLIRRLRYKGGWPAVAR